MEPAFRDKLKALYKASKENLITSLSLKYHEQLCNAAERAASLVQNSASVQVNRFEHSDELVQSLTNIFDELGLKFSYTEDPLDDGPLYYRITGW